LQSKALRVDGRCDVVSHGRRGGASWAT
jgi:hypothetical protein